jgi:hypothetical protein
VTPTQQAIACAASALLLLTLAGLFARGRWATCYSFTVYLAAVLGPEAVFAAWPARFYTHELWTVKELVHSILKFAIVLEVAFRVLRAFPGARATAGKVILGMAGLVYAVVANVPPRPGEPAPELLPRVLSGTIWLFVAVAAIVVWYRLPVDPLHKAILVGFVPYLLVYSAGMAAIETFGWDVASQFSYVYTVAYVALTGYWAVVAWRPAKPGVLPSAC